MKKITALLIAITLFSSCATILTGTKQKVTFKSEKDGTVYQNLTVIGKTNTPIKVSRKDLIKLYTIKTDGCQDKQMELPVKMNPAFLFNIPMAFAYGAGVVTGYIDVLLGSDKKTDKIINVDNNCK